MRSVLKLLAQVGIFMTLAAVLPADAAVVHCFPGEIKLFAGNTSPSTWVVADGKIYLISEHRALYQRIGASFGGDGTTTFAVPNLSNKAPLDHTSYLICADGDESSSSTLLGEVVLYASAQPPPAWTLANGQLLRTDQHSTLFAIYGEHWGGDGINTFAMPNLSSKSPISGVNYVVALEGYFPLESVPSYVGETTILPGSMFPERIMRSANGQLLKINSNPRLFAVIGTYFGGDRVNDFALPNLTPFVPAGDMSYYITDRGEFPSEAR
jgi:microcystin-dependent protein